MTETKLYLSQVYIEQVRDYDLKQNPRDKLIEAFNDMHKRSRLKSPQRMQDNINNLRCLYYAAYDKNKFVLNYVMSASSLLDLEEVEFRIAMLVDIGFCHVQFIINAYYSCLAAREAILVWQQIAYTMPEMTIQ